MFEKKPFDFDLILSLGICIATGLAVYTQKFSTLVLAHDSDLEWGFSFVLSWVSFVLNLFASAGLLVFCVLARREKKRMWPVEAKTVSFPFHEPTAAKGT